MSFAEREPRKAVELEVELKDFTFAKIDADASANLSTGGAFIKMDEPHRPGTLVKFVLKVSAGKDINGVARVVWKRDTEIEPNGPPGVGIKFVKLSPESQALLEEVLVGAKEAPAVVAPASPSEPPRSKSVPPKSKSEPPKKLSKPPASTSEPPKKLSKPPASTSEPPASQSTLRSKSSIPPEKISQPPRAKSVPPAEPDKRSKSIPPGSKLKPSGESPDNKLESQKSASSDGPQKEAGTSSASPNTRVSTPSSEVSASESEPATRKSTPSEPQEARSVAPGDTDKSKSSGTILIAILALGIVGAVIIFVLKGSPSTSPKNDAVAEVASVDHKAEKSPKNDPEKPESKPEKADRAAMAVAATKATDTDAAATDSPNKKDSDVVKDATKEGAVGDTKAAAAAAAATADTAQEEKDSTEDTKDSAQEATKDTASIEAEEAETEEAESGDAAQLVVNSTPEGATVFVDDVAVPGVTPMTIDTLTIGKEAKVRVQLRGFAEKTEKITLSEKKTRINFKLDAAKVRFKMSSNPPNARILIDGKYNGKTPFTFMRARYKPEWHFKLEKRRYKPVEGDIKAEDWKIEGRFHVFTFHADLEPKN